MRVLPQRSGGLFSPERMIHNSSLEFTFHAAMVDPSLVSTTHVANVAYLFPFRLSEASTIRKLGWMNGTSVGNNCDVGVYTNTFARMISTGSTAAAGASVWQWVDVTDTPIGPGKYYLAIARDVSTANRGMRWGNNGPIELAQLFGLVDAASSFPLPDPLVGAAFTTMGQYVCGIRLGKAAF